MHFIHCQTKLNFLHNCFKIGVLKLSVGVYMKNNRIKQLRELNKISVLNLSNILEIPQSTLTRYENGNIEKGKLPIWQKIANYFGVSIGYLQGNSDIKNPFNNNSITDVFNDTLQYMQEVGPQIFETEKNEYNVEKNSENLTPLLNELSKIEVADINFDVEIKGEEKRSNIFKAISVLADLGRFESKELEKDIEKITDLLDMMERRTGLPKELGGYEINKKTSDD